MTPILLYCSEIWFPFIPKSDEYLIERFTWIFLKEFSVFTCQLQTQQCITDLTTTNCKLTQDSPNRTLLLSLVSTECKLSSFCTILCPHHLSKYEINFSVIPVEGLKITCMEKILSDANSMPSLQILSKYPVDGGFLPLMDCIPNQTHRAAVFKLKCGSFNTKIKIRCLVQWGERPANLPILPLQLL